MARLLQDDQGQRLGSTGAGQLPACTAKGLCGRAACRRLARRLSPRLRGKPSWVLADWAFSAPGSVSMTKSLSQKLFLSQAAPREVKCPYGGPRSLSGCRCGVHVRGAGVSETSGSAVAWVGGGTDGGGCVLPRSSCPACPTPAPHGRVASHGQSQARRPPRPSTSSAPPRTPRGALGVLSVAFVTPAVIGNWLM